MEVARFLRAVPLFADLSAEDLAGLARLAVERRYTKGTVIFFENDPGDALYVVKAGHVKIYRVAEDGREKSLVLLGPGEFFGELALLDSEPRSAVAETLSPTALIVLGRTGFVNLVLERPQIALQALRVLSRRLRQTDAQLMDVIFQDVRSRVIRTLYHLAEQHGVDEPQGRRINLKLTHQEIANLAGTSRETVTRTLAGLQDERRIAFDRRYVVIKDFAGQSARASRGAVD